MTLRTHDASVCHISAICGAVICTLDASNTVSALTRALMLGALGQPLEPDGLVVQQRPDEHLRGTQHHLQGRDTSPFAVDKRFPVQRSLKGH